MPYLCSLPLVFQTTEEWLDSELGVHPVQVALQVRGCVHDIVPRGLRRCLGKGFVQLRAGMHWDAASRCALLPEKACTIPEM